MCVVIEIYLWKGRNFRKVNYCNVRCYNVCTFIAVGVAASELGGGSISRLLFGVNEKLLTQHISGLLTKYKLLYGSNQGRVGARAWARVRARDKG